MINTTKDKTQDGSLLTAEESGRITISETNSWVLQTGFVEESAAVRATITRQVGDAHELGSNMVAADDEEMVVASITKPAEVQPTITNLAKDGLSQDIKIYMSKPSILASGNFAVSDTPSTFTSYMLGANLLNSLRKDKLDGALGVKFTAVVTLQINANRFQQGRYILAFVPNGGIYRTAGQATDWYRMHRFSKVQITQLHHVEIDLACDTSAQLRIPWCSAFPMLQFNTIGPRMGDPGEVFIYPYSPLVSPAGSVTAGYSLWIHYEDVEIGGHTVPQSGWVLQGRGSTKKNVDIFKVESENSRPISGALKIISGVSKALESVPILSSVAGPVSWVSDALMRAAYLYGWSKPIIRNGPERMVNNTFPYMCNVDAHDSSMPISLYTSNNVGIEPGFAGTDVDEMSIDFVKSIPAWVRTVAWTTAQTSSTSLLTMAAGVDDYYVSQVDGTANLVSYSPITWLGNQFNYYSGGIVIHLKFVKTEFHSGRLMFWFSPLEYASAPTFATYSTTNYLHKQILDMRECNEVTIEIPYVSIIPWRHTTGPGSNFGQWGLFVLDPLVAPATVSSSVQVLVEVSGGTNLSYAVPKRNSQMFVNPYALQSGWELQGKIDSAGDTCNLTSTTVGGSKVQNINYAREQSCIGEVVKSLRLLLRRGGMWGETYSITHSIGKTVNFFPFSVTYLTGGVTGSPTSAIRGARIFDPFNSFACVYALQRGGVRIKCIPEIIDPTTMFYASLKTTDGNAADTSGIYQEVAENTAQFLYYTANENMVVERGAEGGINIQVPFYHYLPSTPTASNAFTTSTATGQYAGRGNVHARLSVRLVTSGTAPYNTYRSGADDCNFGCFVSIPPMFGVPSP